MAQLRKAVLTGRLLIGDREIRGDAFRDQGARGVPAEEGDPCRDPFLLGQLGDVRGRFDAQRGNPFLANKLE